MYSALFHAGILALTVVSFPNAKPFEVGPTESLPIELLTAQEFEQITKGSKTSKVVAPPSVKADQTAAVPTPDPKQENVPVAKREVKVAAAPPPTPKPAEPEKKPEPKPAEAEAKQEPVPFKMPEPRPEPKPEEPKKAEQPKPEPEKKVVEKPKPKPPEKKQEAEKKQPPKPEQPKFDLNQVASLVDRRAPTTTASIAPQAASQTTAGLASGTASNLSVSERRMIDGYIRDQLVQCWNPPIGASNAEELVVRVGFQLNPDGTLVGNPQLLSSGSGPHFRAAADSALRAVRRCVPLNLPPDAYDYWKDVEINFNPRDMVGG